MTSTALQFPDQVATAEPLGLYADPLHPSLATSPRLRRLLSYWESKRAGRRMPLRAEIDPSEISELLSIMFIIGVEPEPRRHRVRLAGTAINHAFGADYTGSYVDETWPSSTAADRLDCLIETASPYSARTPYGGLQAPLVGYEVLALPLSGTGDGRVSFILGGLDFFDDAGRFVCCEHPARVW